MFVTALVARHIGPAGYGDISLGMAFLAIAQSISNFGIDNIYIGKIVKNKNLTKLRASELFGLKFVSSLFSYFIFLAIIIIFYEKNVAQIVIISAVIFSMFDVFDVLNNASHNYKFSAIARISSCIISSAIKICGIYFNCGVIFFAIANFAEFFLSALFLLTISNFSVVVNPFEKINRIPGLFRAYKWYALSMVMVSIYLRIDHVIVEKICGKEFYGIYSAVVPLVAAWAFIPVTLVSSSMPSMVEAKKISQELFFKKISELTKKLFIFGLFVSIFYVAFGDFIISILFGEKYKDGYYVVCFYSVAMIFSFISNAQSPWIILQNNKKIIFFKALSGVVISFFSTILAAHFYGIVGAAFSVMISQALALLFFGFFFARKLFLCQLVSILRFWSFK
nr:oligosaccharide flippase family protein [Sphaerotilus sp. FB-3]